MSDLIKAIAINRYGGTEVLDYQDIPKPTIKSDQLLVKVRASSINPIDWKIRKGMLKMVIRKNFPIVLGFDVSGEVVEIGSQVTQFKQGDLIYACLKISTLGAYAEYAAVCEKVACLKPQNLTHEEAAAVPLAAQTALQALRDLGQIQNSHRVLINGAAGGVGSFAVQIAQAMNAEVTAVCSAKNAEFVKSLGANRIIDYQQQDFTQEAVKYDIVLDAVASRSFWDCQNVMQPKGTYITTSPTATNLLPILLTGILPGKKAKIILLKPNGKDLAYLKQLIESGKMRCAIARTYPLAEIAAAQTESEQNRVVGKLVITVANG
jgi:NADPH:quinone reductase-like Zn-dependent oxidoreductase